MRVWVEDAGVAFRAGYVYCIAAPAVQTLYIGQTFGGRGALGRLSEHLSAERGNTFRQRIEAVVGPDTEVGPVHLEARRLSAHESFHRDTRDHREAVEFLATYEVIRRMTSMQLRFGLISRSQSNRYTRLAYVRTEASRCARQFCEWLETLPDDGV